MSVQQKSAWYSLGIGLLTLAVYGVLRAVAGANVAPAAMSILALTAVVPRAFPVTPDERERQIERRAEVFGGLAAYLFLVVAGMLVWLTHFRLDPPVVDVGVLPALITGAFVAMLVVRSASVLVLSRRPLAAGD